MTTTSYRPRKNRLYRSRHDRVLGGVCGGIAEHFDLPPWGVRLVLLLLFFTVGFGWIGLVYLVLWIVLPPAPPETVAISSEDEEFWHLYQSSRSSALNKVRRTYESLDKRIQRLETIVTSPGYKLDDEYRNL